MMIAVKKGFDPGMTTLFILMVMNNIDPNGVSICVMTRIFRGKITRKFGGFIKKSRIFREILPRKIWVMAQIETP